jgi:hypothetical protein
VEQQISFYEELSEPLRCWCENVMRFDVIDIMLQLQGFNFIGPRDETAGPVTLSLWPRRLFEIASVSRHTGGILIPLSVFCKLV